MAGDQGYRNPTFEVSFLYFVRQNLDIMFREDLYGAY